MVATGNMEVSVRQVLDAVGQHYRLTLPLRPKSERQWQAVSVAAGILQTHLNYDGEKIGAVLGFVGAVAGEGLAARCAASTALRQVAKDIWHDLANVSVVS